MYSIIEDGHKCVVCNGRAFIYPLCKKCENKYFNVENQYSLNRCKCCGKELSSSQNLCTSCKENKILISTDKVMPVFSYRVWNKELLYRWKIDGNRSLSLLFSDFTNKILKKMEIICIVPVPPRKGKIKENGWDQIDELCKILEYKYGYTVLKLLVRNSTCQQKKLDRNNRLETIKNAYSFAEEWIVEKELRKNTGKIPEEIVLIDDVTTTGATIESCAKILKDKGIKKVNVVTLFTVD